MRPCSSALSTFLSNAANLNCVQVDLYTFVLTSGQVLRWSGGDAPLTVSAAGFPTGSYNAGASHTFALGPRFGRSKVTTKIGVEPAELDIQIIAGANDLIGTFPFAEAVRIGFFDGATVELDRFFAPPQAAGAGVLDTSLGVLVWFYGRIADVDLGRSKIMMKVKSLMNLLAIQQMPRRLYGASCSHIFGDAMCGYDRVNGKNAAGASTGLGQITVTAAATTQAWVTTTGTVPNGYIQGTLTGATGGNAGVGRAISGVLGATVYLLKALPYAVAIGDTFNLAPGCDHTTATCSGTFSNLARFGGFPYIPPPEYAV